MSTPVVIGGDCLKGLRDMESESVHAIVTDPPYGLSQVDSVKLTTALTAWVNGDRESVPGGKGFMGKEWDAFVPPPAVWDECMRVLKPGGHMLVFAGSRTVDLMGLSIRLAGFEIRDTLQWLYGSGFPKSHNVHKSTGDSRFEGWGTALKPAAEPIILARKPMESTVAGNVLTHGVGAMNIDGCRVAGDVPQVTQGVNSNGSGYRVAKVKQLSQPHSAGRFPANVILSHSETCTDDACDLWCPVAELDAQSGASVSRVGNPRSSAHSGVGWGMTATGSEYDDSGGASRFFPTFRYQAKAPKSERPKVDGVSHPTVKPVAVMWWLVRLITPPGGTVLDPFAGSGTTLQAATEEGFASIGIERDPDYLKLINARLGFDIAQKDAA